MIRPSRRAFAAPLVFVIAIVATPAPEIVAPASLVQGRLTAIGRPGVTPVPCPQQEWQYGEAAFDALTGANAFFGRYDGGLYRIEIPDQWNGELVLYAHGYVANTGTNGSTLRVGPAQKTSQQPQL